MKHTQKKQWRPDRMDKIKYLDMICDIRNEMDLNEFQEATLHELEEIIEFGEPTQDHLDMVEQRIF